MMVANGLVCLVFAWFQTAPDAVFRVNRPSLVLETQKQVFILGSQAESLDFALKYAGTLSPDAVLEAELSGGGLSQPVLLQQNAAGLVLRVPTAQLSNQGTYHVSAIRLSAGGTVVETASPNSAQIDVVADILVSRVEVRQLSEADLLDRGYLFNETDYQTVEFNLALVAGAKQISVDLPVAFPRKQTSSFHPVVVRNPHQPYFQVLSLPPAPKSVKQFVHVEGELEATANQAYSVYSLLLIPGEVQYLKSHFSANVLVVNAAPEGVSVTVDRVKAKLNLPQPTLDGFPVKISGADPHRELVFIGEDGLPGTADDRSVFFPGEEARAEYLLTGELPGIYPIEVELTGTAALPQGPEPVTSRAKGWVYVRAAEFSVTFEHPEAVAAGEPYQLDMHFLNLGGVALDGLSVVLDPGQLTGVQLNGSDAVQNLGSLPAGGEVTASYQLEALVSGKVVASYHQVGSGNSSQLVLRVGVADSGETISPYVFKFPPVLEGQLGAALADPLKRYLKKLHDTAQMKPGELPQGMMSVNRSAVHRLGENFVRAAQSASFGLGSRAGVIHAFLAWLTSVDYYEPIDHLRRQYLAEPGLDFETLFGNALAAELAGLSADQVLALLVREIPAGVAFQAAVIDADPAINWRITHDGGREMNTSGTREIPFAARLPLQPGRSLVWLQRTETDLQIEFDAHPGKTVAVAAAWPRGKDGQRVFAQSPDLTLNVGARITAGTSSGNLTWQMAESRGNAVASELLPSPFELVHVRQLDRNVDEHSDEFGRDLMFVFSKPVALGSLDPLDEHVTINGKAAVDIRLQADGRILLISSAMPLGPYHPISYEIKGILAKGGTVPAHFSGSFDGSPAFAGVWVYGRVADHHGSSLEHARVFLWQLDDTTSTHRWVIFDETVLDTDGRYQFDFAQIDFLGTAPEHGRSRSLGVGVLLEDGRYRYAQFFPQGAGAGLQADFAFNQLGTVWGEVRGLDGQPAAGAAVYVANQLAPNTAKLVQTDAFGRYRAEGVEVGQVVVSTEVDGILGTGSGYLTQNNSPIRVDLQVDQPEGSLAGQVFVETEHGPAPLADAAVGWIHNGGQVNQTQVFGVELDYSVLGTTGEDGRYQLARVPAGNGIAFVFHPRFGRLAQQLVIAAGSQPNLDFTYPLGQNSGGTISGYVHDENGLPMGGVSLRVGGLFSQTAADGSFGFTGLPLNVSFYVLAQKGGRDGRVRLFLDEANPQINDVLIIARPEIQVSGVYLDASGNPVPFARIRYFHSEGIFFRGVETDAQGRWTAIVYQPDIYEFGAENPPRIAYQKIYVGENGLSNVVLQERASGDFRVKLVDGNLNPVVATVEVASWLPDVTSGFGLPAMATSHRVFTGNDGEVLIRAVNAGEVRITGTSPILGRTDTLVLDWQAQNDDPVPTFALAFPHEEPAALSGVVYRPGGIQPAPVGTVVQVRYNGVTAQQETDELGRYRFAALSIVNEPVPVKLSVFEPGSNLFAHADLVLKDDLHFRHDILLAKRGDLHVSVVHADGTPADAAALKLWYLDAQQPQTGDDVSLFNRSVQGQITPAQNEVVFSGIPAGPITIQAVSGNGLGAFRQYAMPDADDFHLKLQLEAASSIGGVFQDGNGDPIPDAEVVLFRDRLRLLQQLSGNAAGSLGTFAFSGLPMRAYELQGTDPATALQAHLRVVTSAYNPDPNVVLQLDPVGNLEGTLTHAGMPVANGVVTLRGRLGLKLLTGTDSSGRFTFMNLPLGEYRLTGSHHATAARAQAWYRIAEGGQTVNGELPFEAVRDLNVRLHNGDGSPASHVLLYLRVRGRPLTASALFTDADGLVRFPSLPPGEYRVEAEHPVSLERIEDALIHTGNALSDEEIPVSFPGSGEVFGQIRDAFGGVLEEPAQLEFVYFRDDLPVRKTIHSTASGAYRLAFLPLDQQIKLNAYNPATAETSSQEIRLTQPGEVLQIDLSFRAATHATGTVRFQDGQPVSYARLWINDPVYRENQADAAGQFYMTPLLSGGTRLFAADPRSPRETAIELEITSGDGLPQPLTGLDMRLGGLAHVTGQALLADGAPLSRGSVRLEVTELGCRFETLILADGSYRFSHLPLGTYQLEAYDPQRAKTGLPQILQASADGQSLTQYLTFETGFTLSGRIMMANGLTPAANVHLSLYRQSLGAYSRETLVYRAETSQDGFYHVDTVYPGHYRLVVKNTAASAGFETELFMAAADKPGFDMQLQQVASILGTVRDPNGKVFPHGRVVLSKNGQVVRTVLLQPDGSFEMQPLFPGSYEVKAQVLDGWFEAQTNVVLSGGPLPVALVTGEAITLTGRAIYQHDEGGVPFARFKSGGKTMSLTLDPSGFFTAPWVPVDVALHLELDKAGAHRSFDVGAFSAASDLGSFYLDGTAPQVSWAAAGMAVSSLPWTLQLEIDEPEFDSSLVTEATRVWLDGREISGFFTTTGSGVSGSLPYFPPGTTRGSQKLKVQVRNTSGKTAKRDFDVDVAITGTTVLAQVQSGSAGVAGEVRLDSGGWSSTDANGLLAVYDVSAGLHTLQARGDGLGKRSAFTVDGDAVTQAVRLRLGHYGGYAGTVLLPNGNPAAGARVSIGDEFEITGTDGRFFFDFLDFTYTGHTMLAELGSRIGILEGERLLLNREVVPQLDIQLHGRGTVTGIVLQGDGVTGVSGAQLQLSYPSFPHEYGRSLTAGSGGQFQIENVIAVPFDIVARDSQSGLSDTQTSQIPHEGETLDLQLQLAPSTALTGVLLTPAGSPAAGIEISATTAGLPDVITVTAADGSFSLEPVARLRQLCLDAEDMAAKTYYSGFVTAQNAVLDVGNLTMVADLPPVISAFPVPDPLDPGRPYYQHFTGEDDRGVTAWKISFSGVYDEARDSTYHTPQTQVTTSGIRFLMDGISEGTLNYTFEMTDTAGHVTQTSGSVEVRYDHLGPQVAVLSPVQGSVYTEGSMLAVEASASDASGIDRVELRYQGQVLASDETEPYQLAGLAIGVTVAQDVTYQVVAIDNAGNQTPLDLRIHITPVIAADAPVMTVKFPFGGMALPLALPSGLTIPFRADVHDSDGLERYELWVNGNFAASGWLLGTASELKFDWTVPQAFRDGSDLTAELRVFDLGGNMAASMLNLIHADGMVWQAQTPLELAWHDTAHEGKSVILDGGYHRIDGSHQFTHLFLVNGAVLTQAATDEAANFIAGTRLQVDGHAVLAPDTRVYLDGKGFAYNPPWVGGGSKGSHGGLAHNDPLTSMNRIYGSPFQPVDCGSYQGGGAFKLTADSLWMAGWISANGGLPPIGSNLDRGSGGSIWLQAQSKLAGFGLLQANGNHQFNTVLAEGAGGGRIAVYGDFQGDAEAFGGNGGGAGTVYLRRPNPDAPDGADDVLRIANHPQANEENFSAIPIWQGVVGTDLNLVHGQVSGIHTVDQLNFLNNPELPWNGLLGMKVYREGDYTNGGLIDGQDTLRLVSRPNESFPAFAAGETVQVGYQVDRIEVVDRGYLHLQNQAPRGFLWVENGSIYHHGSSVLLDAWDWQQTATLDGHFSFGDLVTKPQTTLKLNGSITAQTLHVVADSMIRSADDRANAALVLNVPQMTVDGTVRARLSLLNLGLNGDFLANHGGLRQGQSGEGFSYGSPYRAETPGYPRLNMIQAGGQMRLQFDALILNGSLDADAHSHLLAQNNGSGGGIMLAGQSLSGNGTISANGSSGEKGSGGGRIAILVDDISGFGGNATAYGGASSFSNTPDGGAGTLYYRTLQWPRGKLVIDNGGLDPLPNSTPLPGLGSRTVAGATGGTEISGTGFAPLNGLAGLYVKADGAEPVAIESNLEDRLIPVGSFPVLNPGDHFTGLHLLDVLEVRNGGKLYSPDPIEVFAGVVIDNGVVDAPVTDHSIINSTVTLSDGTGELHSDDGHQIYILDNYQLTVHFPLDVSRIELSNGAKLIYRNTLKAGDMVVDNATLEAGAAAAVPELQATNLSLANNAIWTVADRAPDGKAFRLRGVIGGTLAVDASSRITTTGNNKAPNNIRPWGSQNLSGHSFGGFRSMSRDRWPPKEYLVMGSYAFPTWQGKKGAGGGAIYLDVGQFTLHGHVQADGVANYYATGGSIWLQVASLTGTGKITAKASTQTSRGSGGRIAVYYPQDGDIAESISIDAGVLNENHHFVEQQGGAGTVFLKSSQQTYGTLIADQQMVADLQNEDALLRNRLTGVPGAAKRILALEDDDPDPWKIRDRSWDWWDLPPGLGGLYVRFEVSGTAYELRILDNTYDTLMLDPGTGLEPPATLPLGTEISFVLKLDKLVLRNGAQFHFAGQIEISELVIEGAGITSLWCQNLTGLAQYQFEQTPLRLILEEPAWHGHSLTVSNTTLYLDRPLQIADLSLLNGQLRHSPVWEPNKEYRVPPYLHLTANTVSADAGSAFNVAGLNPRYWWLDVGEPRNHGGLGDSRETVFGSLFQPDKFGAGFNTGGRIYLKTQTLNGGQFLANGGAGGAGGSIWLEAAVLNGQIDLNANRGSGVNTGGGRIALYYGNRSNAAIEAHAVGSRSAGTIFMKDTAKADGELFVTDPQVTDQYGEPLTPLPVLSPGILEPGFTVNYLAGSDQTQLLLPGLSTPENFAGYFMVFDGDRNAPVAIAENRNMSAGLELVLQGDQTHLTESTTWQMAVRFEEVHLCEGCLVGTEDLIILYEPSFPAGHVFADGQANLVAAPVLADGHLELDNFQLEIQAPIDVSQVTLRNGAKLTIKPRYGDGTSQLGQVNLDNASLTAAQRGDGLAPVVQADTMTLVNARVSADHLAVTGALSVDPDSKIEGFSVQTAAFEWPPGTPLQPDWDDHHSFGGTAMRYGTNPGGFAPVFGSFSQPWMVGKDRKRLRIQAGSLHVDGLVKPDQRPIPQAGGGALHIETGELSGNGSLSVAIAPQAYRGGGRMAVYYSGNAAWQGQYLAHGRTQSGGGYVTAAGSGTVFLKADGQTHGDLFVSGHGQKVNDGSTAVVALGRRSLSGQVSVNGAVLTDPEQQFPFSLQGLFMVFDWQGSQQALKILANTPTSITLDGVLPALEPGTEIWTRLHLDNLTVAGGANFHFGDEMVVDNQLQFSEVAGQVSLLWVKNLSLATEVLNLNGQHGGFAIEEGHNLREIHLSDSSLHIDFPMNLEALSLANNSVLAHSKIMELDKTLYPNHPALDLTLNTFTVDASSVIDVRGKGFPTRFNDQLWDRSRGHSGGDAHAGVVDYMGSAYAYGSAFDPHSPGIWGGAGVVRVSAGQIQLEGDILANGRVGGSVKLEAGLIAGGGLIDVSGLRIVGEEGSAGRVALIYDQLELLQFPLAKSLVEGGKQIGAGTIFLRQRGEALGDLYLINDYSSSASQILATPILAMGQHTLAQGLAQNDVLEQAGAAWRNSLRGMLLVDDASGETYRITANGPEFLKLDRPISPAPVAGWQYHGRLPVANLYQINAALQADDETAYQVHSEVDLTPPVISQVSLNPGSGGVLNAGSLFSADVTAVDETAMDRVEIRFNGESQTALPAQGFQFQLTAPPVTAQAVFELEVLAFDQRGNLAIWQTPLTVNPSETQAPQVSLLTPASGSQFTSLDTIEVRVQASDNLFVDKLTLSLGGTNSVHQLSAAQQNIPLTFYLPVPATPLPQTWTLVAQAEDVSGNTAVDSVTLSVLPYLLDVPVPAAFWPLDESDRNGVVMADRIGPNTAELKNGASLADGKVGQALALDGSTKHLHVPQNVSLDATETFTFSAWVRFNQLQAGAAIATYAASGVNNSVWHILAQQNGSRMRLKFHNVVNGGWHWMWGSSMDLDRWYHIAARFDRGELRFFVDGVEVAQKTLGISEFVMVPGRTLALGRDHRNTNDGRMDGSIDEVAIWDKALDASAISQIYRAGAAGHQLDMTLPDEVTGLQVTPAANSLDVAWNPSANTAANLAAYRVAIQPAGQSFDLSPATTTYQFMGLDPQTEYTVRVQTINQSGLISPGVSAQAAPYATVDSQAPSVSLLAPLAGSAGNALETVDVQVQVSDNQMVTQLSLSLAGHGEIHHLTTAEQNTPLSYPIPVPMTALPQTWQLTAQAMDAAGNVASDSVALDINPFVVDVPWPVAYWPLDEAGRSGVMMADLAGIHVGELKNGAGLSAGVLDEGLSLDGNNQYLHVPQDSALDMTEQCTLSAWVYLDQTQAFAPIATYAAPGVSSSVWQLMLKEINGGMILKAQSRINGSWHYLEGPALTVGQWHHVAMRFAAGDLRLYLDGVEQAQTNLAITQWELVAGRLFALGRDHRYNNYYHLDGRLDEVGLWNRALDHQAIYQLYLSGTANHPLDLNLPGEVSAVRVTPAANSLSLSWIGSSDPHANLAGYLVSVQPGNHTAVLPEGQTAYTVDGLDPETLYTLHIKAINQSGMVNAGMTTVAATLPISGTAPEPVAYWTLDNTDLSGGQVQARIGGHHSAANTAVSGLAGVAGEALHFTQAAHRVDFGANADFDITQTLSISAWVKPDAVVADGAVLSYGSTALENYSLLTQAQAGYDELAFAVTGPSARETLAAPLPAMGAWVHVAVTFDNGQVSLYVNGALASQAIWTLTSLPLGDPRELIFGHGLPSLLNPYQGQLDEVAIWDEVLSPEWLAILYQRNLRGEALFEAGAGESGKR